LKKRKVDRRKLVKIKERELFVFEVFKKEMESSKKWNSECWKKEKLSVF
jgi:hypothetical protein